jgi:AcrR family transcriptional regulator
VPQPPQPAYTRLQTDERRRLLLDRATELFATHGYDELSMAKLARAAGISKALLYHYFPSKRELFVAALTDAAEELRARTEPEPGHPPAQQLALALDAFLRWVEDHGPAYAKLLRSASVPEVRELVDEVRDRTAQRILAELGPAGERAPARAAVHGWLWSVDGACLDWIEHRDLRRDELQAVLLGALAGALAAAGAGALPGA